MRRLMTILGAWASLRRGPCDTGPTGREVLERPGLRDLLIIGATQIVRWRSRHDAPAGSWMVRILATKPKMLIAVTLANKIARLAWALMRGDGVYLAPASA
ncbi:hypothetical protein [Paenirhodobacter sp.]|uniref:hypothetical protein n=1 Tax=Paenirhodobacter sp. TaxID=1965326 RepID=UPI003B3EF045